MSNTEDAFRNSHQIAEEDRRKAQVLFDRGRTAADGGNYEDAIEVFIHGLDIDPENVDAHQKLRDISLKRKTRGGKDMGMFARMKLKARNDKQSMLNAEKLLAYSPGDTDRMLKFMQSAYRAGCHDTVTWIAPILRRAIADCKPRW